MSFLFYPNESITKPYRQTQSTQRFSRNPSRRIPIFNQSYRQSPKASHNNHNNFRPASKHTAIFNNPRQTNRTTSAVSEHLFQPQRNTSKLQLNERPSKHVLLSESVVINYDFCGCQGRVVPCSIIQTTFLADVSVEDMKREYSKLYAALQYHQATNQPANQSLSMTMSRKVTQFCTRILPKNYPQVFIPHLNNLLKMMETERSTYSRFLLGQGEFVCLSWIQYHCKVQYVTYFLYKDLRKSFNDFNMFLKKFIGCLQLQQRGLFGRNSDILWQREFPLLGHLLGPRYKGQTQRIVQDFLRHYYKSVGACLIPATYYSCFLRLVFEKDRKCHRILSLLLIGFMQTKKEELQTLIALWIQGKYENYWNILRQINWQGCFRELGLL